MSTACCYGSIRRVTEPGSAEAQPPQPEGGVTDRPLRLWERAVFGVVGLAAGSVGATGVFIDGANAAGTLALIGVGAVFGYLGGSGQRLTTFKVGGAEARLGRVTDAVTDIVLKNEDIPNEARREVAEQLDDIALPPSSRRAVREVLTAAEEGVRFDDEIELAIERVRGDDLVAWTAPKVAAWDALLRRKAPEDGPDDFGAPAVVMLKWSGRPLTHGEVLTALQRIPLELVRDVVVVFNMQPAIPGLVGNPQGFSQTFGHASLRWQAVVWRDPSDDQALAEAIDHALGQARSHPQGRIAQLDTDA